MPAALTTLAEDERLFADSVYEFADREVRPLVREMDESAHTPRALIDKLFALGVMGIEIPESAGGAGATFFHAVLAVEALKIFQQRQIDDLVVVDDNRRPVGIVDSQDLPKFKIM